MDMKWIFKAIAKRLQPSEKDIRYMSDEELEQELMDSKDSLGYQHLSLSEFCDMLDQIDEDIPPDEQDDIVKE